MGTAGQVATTTQIAIIVIRYIIFIGIHTHIYDYCSWTNLSFRCIGLIYFLAYV